MARTVPSFGRPRYCGRTARLGRAVDAGAAVLAVCAGYQIVGRTFPGADGRALPGIGLLDVSTVKGSGRRAVGEVLAEPIAGGLAVGGLAVGGLAVGGWAAGSSTAGGGPEGGAAVGWPAEPLPTLTGFENHGGVTTVGPGARPLARVAAGVGNGSGDGTEGAWAGRVVGTYLHGPVLARNPALADVLLGWAIGRRLDFCPTRRSMVCVGSGWRLFDGRREGRGFGSAAAAGAERPGWPRPGWPRALNDQAEQEVNHLIQSSPGVFAVGERFRSSAHGCSESELAR